MRSRCAAGIFHRSAVFSSRICLLLHLTIRPPESDSNSESYRSPQCETEKYRKPLDSISYGSGMRARAPVGKYRTTDMLVTCRHSRCVAGSTAHLTRSPRQSSFTPHNLTTLAHLAVSSAMNLAKSA